MRKFALRSVSAFSLIEVTLAVGIIAFAVIALYGLLPTSIATVRSGASEETATDILYSAAADLRRTQTAQTNSPFYQLPVEANPSAATSRFFDATGSLLPEPTDARFRLEVNPCTNPNPRFSVWHLTVFWPAQATSPSSSTESVVILNRP